MNTNSYRSILSTLALGALLLVGSHSSAQAQYKFFPSNATINYALPSGDLGAIVGYPNQSHWSSHTGGTSPTINVIAGASMGDLFAYNSSIVNISGGTVNDTVLAQDNSTVTITGGSIGDVNEAVSATVNVHGGHITGYLTGTYGGTVNVYGGKISGTYAGVADGSTMNVYGGDFVSGLLEVGIATDLVSTVAIGPATLNMYCGLTVRKVGFIYMLVPSLSIASVTSISGGYEYTLQGSLRDGTNVTGMKVGVLTGSTFNIYAPTIFL